tara:strand:+ start:1623 stop:2378 length:756 start_codon:yes stop_codon:yes gene_type:complete
LWDEVVAPFYISPEIENGRLYDVRVLYAEQAPVFFERSILPEHHREGLVRKLEQVIDIEYLDDVRLSDLEVPPDEFTSFHPITESLFKFEYVVGGDTYSVFLKDTGFFGEELTRYERIGHGLDYGAIIEQFRLFRAYVAGGVDAHAFEVHLPEMYGAVYDRFLCMEYLNIEDISDVRFSLASKSRFDLRYSPWLDSFVFAQNQVERNIDRFLEANDVDDFIQFSHAMVAGNSFPMAPSQGVWHFFLPYDIV